MATAAIDANAKGHGEDLALGDGYSCVTRNATHDQSPSSWSLARTRLTIAPVSGTHRCVTESDWVQAWHHWCTGEFKPAATDPDAIVLTGGCKPGYGIDDVFQAARRYSSERIDGANRSQAAVSQFVELARLGILHQVNAKLSPADQLLTVKRTVVQPEFHGGIGLLP